jgi:hypothetical protein
MMLPQQLFLEHELGKRVQAGITDTDRNYEVNFTFPFYGKAYSDLFIASSGVITMGEPFWQPNMQGNVNYTKAIFPLFIDLNPNCGGGVYVREDTDTNRLIVTGIKYRPFIIRMKTIRSRQFYLQMAPLILPITAYPSFCFFCR